MRSDDEYLNDIVAAGAKIESYIRGMTAEDLGADARTEDAVIRQLTIIGEASSRLSVECKQRYPEIDWRDIVRMRNILTHVYFGVASAAVWDAAWGDVPDLLRLLAEAPQPDE